MNQQLIQSIEQQLENLMHFDGDLAYQYECKLYRENEEPITELFTSELLTELEDLVYKLDNEKQDVETYLDLVIHELKWRNR